MSLVINVSFRSLEAIKTLRQHLSELSLEGSECSNEVAAFNEWIQSSKLESLLKVKNNQVEILQKKLCCVYRFIHCGRSRGGGMGCHFFAFSTMLSA